MTLMSRTEWDSLDITQRAALVERYLTHTTDPEQDAFDAAADAREALELLDHQNGDCTRDPACCRSCEEEWDAEMDRRYEEMRDARLEGLWTN